MKIEKICLLCENKFYVYKNRQNVSKYCSIKCSSLSKLGVLNPRHNSEKACLNCGGLYKDLGKSKFNKIGRKGRGIKFCSQKCHGEYLIKIKRINKVCLFCGKKFTVILSRKNRRKYCSLECRDNCLINKRKKMKLSRFNEAEIKLNNIIHNLNLPYRYVGNGEVWIAGLNPNFINTNSQKKIIELFGEGWHKQGCNKKISIRYTATEEGRREIFKRYGYDMLVLWSKELKNVDIVKQKLLDFEKSPHIG